MSTRLLYHTHGGKDLHYCRFETEGGIDFYYATVLPNYIKCPTCGNKDVIKKGIRRRIFSSVPTGHRANKIIVDINRVYCSKCNKIAQVKLIFADKMKSYTKRLEQAILIDSDRMCIRDLANRYKLNYDSCYKIIINNLKERYSSIDLTGITKLAIDEILFKHGHKYVTIVINYDNGKIIYAELGKHAGALKNFYEQLTPEGCAKIEAVSMDMSQAYISSVEKNLPNAKIIFDHFHVIKLLNTHLSNLRTELAHQLSKEGKKYLFGIRWLLLKNRDNLLDERNERERLDKALDDNKPLSTGYYLKEAIRQIWLQPDKISAKKVIDDWIISSKASNINQLEKMGETLKKYEYGILNWYDYKITSGQMEGINNKIKVLMRNSYGIRNFEVFKLHLFALHESRELYNKL